jgi:hypothetical protein
VRRCGKLVDAYEIRRDVVWPSELALPPRPPAVIYVDLNHFVNMARIIAGKPAPGYAELLEACRKSVKEGRAVFPLSATHLMEMAAISSSRRRDDVAAVMEELSGFRYLLGRPIIQMLEVEESLRAMGIDVPLAGGGDLIGRGGLYPFGRRSELVIEGEDGQAAFERLRERLGTEAVNQWMAEANREAQRLLLTGGDEGHDGLSAWQEILNNRAAREINQARQIDAEPEWRRERLRDLVSASEVYAELNKILAAGIAERVELEELFPEVNDARRFTDGMPSTRVAITIKTHYHRNGQHQWKPNDVHDIDAMSVAVPYCDAVYTDKAVRNALVSNEDEVKVFGTFMPRCPQDLTGWLNTRPAPA